MTTLTFTVIGEPMTKGSVTAFVPKRADGSFRTRPDGSPMVVKTDDTGRRGKSAMATLAYAALEARAQAGIGCVMREASLAITLRFYTARPKSHFGTGRNAGVLKDSAPARPAKRPDVDKYVRHVLDALRGVVYHDDAQVVELLAIKEYDEPPRTEIEITPIAQQTVGRVVPSEQLALAA